MRIIFLAAFAALLSLFALAQESLDHEILQFIEEYKYPTIDMARCSGPILDVLHQTDFSEQDEVSAGHQYLRALGCFDRFSRIELGNWPELDDERFEELLTNNFVLPPTRFQTNNPVPAPNMDLSRYLDLDFELNPSWEMVPTGGTLYIRVRDFLFPTAEMDEGFRDLETRPGGLGSFSRVILDLRSNRGGRVDKACELLGHFASTFASGSYLEQKGGMHERWPTCVSLQYIPSTTEVLVLVNGESASASEYVAAVLAENSATTIGSRTYGKGASQVEKSFGPYLIHITTEEFRLSTGERLNGRGLEPTIQSAFGGCAEDLLCLLERVNSDLALHKALQEAAQATAAPLAPETAAAQ